MKLCWSGLALGSLAWALTGCPGGPKPLPGGPPPEYETPRAFPGGEGADVATPPEADDPGIPEPPPPAPPPLPEPPAGAAGATDAGATDAGATDAGGPALAPAPGP